MDVQDQTVDSVFFVEIRKNLVVQERRKRPVKGKNVHLCNLKV